jgi:formylglycine-generating enzyme required for sulfatase activity
MRASPRISQRIKGVDFKLNYIPAGEFWMGSDDESGHSDEYPRHQVKITKPFYMAQSQVTQAQWKAVMGSDLSYFKGTNLPVDQVSWFDCIRFCNAISQADGLDPVYIIGSGDGTTMELDLDRNGYRLPTEAEWEYAAKAGTELTYAGSNTVDEVAWYSSKPGSKTHPVAQKKANAWGLFDLSGNVFEWCNDKWNESAYQGRTSVTTDPIEWVESVFSHVCRGGSWRSCADGCRVSFRYGHGVGGRWNRLGFRFLRGKPLNE